MLSSVYYSGKNLARQRREAAKSHFLQTLLAKGPWAVNIDALAAVAKYNRDNNREFDVMPRLAEYARPQNLEAEFIYLPAGKNIFVIWRKAFETRGFPDLAPLKAAWRKRMELLNILLEEDAPSLEPLYDPGFRYATIGEITANRASFPQFLPNTSGFGRCADANGNARDLQNNFNDGGSPSSTLHFTVCVAPLRALAKAAKGAEPEDARKLLLNADASRQRMRPLPETLLTDNTLGHWDLFWPENAEAPEAHYQKITLDSPLQARDPSLDVLAQDAVAIDFGTSSTVAAVYYKGKIRLARIGGDDLEAEASKNPFENPTALQFDNAARLLETWQSEPYRPAISATDATCTHQAKQELNSHVATTMINLKSWARRDPKGQPLLLRDGKNAGLAFLPPQTPPGIEIEKDFQQAPLNPIELYAYYLGLNLNNQLVEGGRIFSNYYMTFPVMFERAAKERILASFRRGLIRSLPPSLIYACGFDVSAIKVTEKANEPAAFAAAALPALRARKFTFPSAEVAEKLRELARLHQERPWSSQHMPTPEELSADKAAFRKHFQARGLESLKIDAEAALENIKALREKLAANPAAAREWDGLLESLQSQREDPDFKEGLELLAEAEANGRDDLEKVPVNGYLLYEMFTALQSSGLLAEIKASMEIEAETRKIQEAALASLAPTEKGEVFGVFDFGGGTTDFAIGLYRLPTEEEEVEEGWEEVVDILDVSGDPDLGGEHLVEQMAFEVVRANREALVQQNIHFVKPENSPHVSGGEKLFYRGATARANTRTLMEKLRPLWETGGLELEGGQIAETYMDGNGGEKRQIKLDVDAEALLETLRTKIGKAVDDFFILFAQAIRKAEMGAIGNFHIILAGNSCRSPLVRECFTQKAKELMLAGGKPEKRQIIIHAPLLADAANPEAVSIKTGVALGLLKTLPHERTGVVLRKKAEAEAPFAYTVGPLSHGCLKPVLARGCAYDQWFKFGVCTRLGAHLILYSLSPQALEGTLPRDECGQLTVDFGEGHKGAAILIRAKSPKAISVALEKEGGGVEMEKEFTLA